MKLSRVFCNNIVTELPEYFYWRIVKHFQPDSRVGYMAGRKMKLMNTLLARRYGNVYIENYMAGFSESTQV